MHLRCTSRKMRLRAGHIGTEYAVLRRRPQRLSRHDYLNRTGIGATRALMTTRCLSGVSSPISDDLPAVLARIRRMGTWISRNLPYVVEQTARIQVEFALALAWGENDAIIEMLRETPGCAAWETSGPEGKPPTSCAGDLRSRGRERIRPQRATSWRVARLLDPSPSWTLTNDRLPRRRFGALTALQRCCMRHSSYRKTFEGARLRRQQRAGRRCVAGRHLPQSIIGDPLDPCGLVQTTPRGALA